MSVMVVYGDVPSVKQLRVSVREVFFTKSRMPLKKWLLLLHCWVRQYPAKDAAEEAEVDPNTACDIYRYFFGGSSRHKPKVKLNLIMILHF